MERINDRGGIIGIGCTKVRELWDKDVEDLVVEACYEAFEDAGIKPEDVQAGWLGSSYSTHRGVAIAQGLKLRGIPVTRIENACAAGTDVFRNGSYAVAAGIYDIVLACGVGPNKQPPIVQCRLETIPHGASIETAIPSQGPAFVLNYHF